MDVSGEAVGADLTPKEAGLDACRDGIAVGTLMRVENEGDLNGAETAGEAGRPRSPVEVRQQWVEVEAMGQWWPARVVDVDEGAALIHFKGFITRG